MLVNCSHAGAPSHRVVHSKLSKSGRVSAIVEMPWSSCWRSVLRGKSFAKALAAEAIYIKREMIRPVRTITPYTAYKQTLYKRFGYSCQEALARENQLHFSRKLTV